MKTKYDRILPLLTELQDLQRQNEAINYDPCGDEERRVKQETVRVELELDKEFRSILESL